MELRRYPCRSLQVKVSSLEPQSCSTGYLQCQHCSRLAIKPFPGVKQRSSAQ